MHHKIDNYFLSICILWPHQNELGPIKPILMWYANNIRHVIFSHSSNNSITTLFTYLIDRVYSDWHDFVVKWKGIYIDWKQVDIVKEFLDPGQRTYFVVFKISQKCLWCDWRSLWLGHDLWAILKLIQSLFAPSIPQDT